MNDVRGEMQFRGHASKKNLYLYKDTNTIISLFSTKHVASFFLQQEIKSKVIEMKFFK